MPSERIDALLGGKTPDRLPWAPEINEGFARKLTGKPPSDPTPYRKIEEAAARQIGADFLHRVVSVKTVRHACEEEFPGEEGVRIIHTPAGDLREKKVWDSQSGTFYSYEHLIKGPESFDAYLAMVEDETYEPDFEAAAEEIADSDLPTIDVPASPLMHLMLWEMGVETTIMAMIEHEDAMAELLARIHAKNLEYYRVATAGPGRIFRPMEDTSSKLTGPAMYEKHSVDHLNDYADIVHAAGRSFIVHMCGHLGGPMPKIISGIRLDGIEAITTPPLGDADMAELRGTLGDDVWLIGGVDPSRYAVATPEEMIAHVQHTLDVMRGDRRFMLGHEEIPLAAKPENIQAVADLVAGTSDGFYD